MDAAYVYNAIAERVIDGDTYQLQIDLGFRVALSINGRLHGVDCPEMKTEEGKRARAVVKEMLLPENGTATPLVVQSYKDRQSFARWVVDIWLPNGDSLAEQLLKQDLAKVMIIA